MKGNIHVPNNFFSNLTLLLIIVFYMYSENIVFYDDLEVEEKFLTLDELGTVLKRLSEQLPGTVFRG